MVKKGFLLIYEGFLKKKGGFKSLLQAYLEHFENILIFFEKKTGNRVDLLFNLRRILISVAGK